MGGTDNVGDHPKPIRSYSMVLAVFFNRIPKKWLSWLSSAMVEEGLAGLAGLAESLKRFPKYLVSGVDKTYLSLPAVFSLFHNMTLAGNQWKKNEKQTNSHCHFSSAYPTDETVR